MSKAKMLQAAEFDESKLKKEAPPPQALSSRTVILYVNNDWPLNMLRSKGMFWVASS